MTSFKPDDDVKDKGSEVDYEAGKPGGLPNQSMSPSPLRRLRSRSRRRCHRVTTRPRHRPRSSTSSKRLRDARHTDSNGRLREISRKLWYYLRGHALADSLPSPEMDFTDLPMDWNEVREYLCRKSQNVVDWEILQVIRSSDAPHFQLQVAKPDNETTT